VYLLEWLHLVALRDHCGCRFLITLGGCRQLDSLEQRISFGMCWRLFVADSGGCERSCTFPDGELKGNSDCSCHWVTLLVGRFLQCPIVWTWLVQHLLAARTTKCWSTQQGLVCRQACEPWEKKYLSLAHWYSPGDWLVFILWLVLFSTWWYNHLAHSITFSWTSCSKLFSVRRIESLHCSLSSSSGAL
jgi:hypothetical protein